MPRLQPSPELLHDPRTELLRVMRVCERGGPPLKRVPSPLALSPHPETFIFCLPSAGGVGIAVPLVGRIFLYGKRFGFLCRQYEIAACNRHFLQKKPPLRKQRRELGSGSDLLFRAVSSQVPSALRGLTSVFGMGTGGTLSSLPPEIVNLFSGDCSSFVRPCQGLSASPPFPTP